VNKSDRVKLATFQIKLDQLRIKAAVSANVVEFFKKNSALTQVDVN
jgi:hypothetical protein